MQGVLYRDVCEENAGSGLTFLKKLKESEGYADKIKEAVFKTFENGTNLFIKFL